MGENRVQLLTGWFSTFGQRVEIALKFKGVPYERVEVALGADKPKLLIDANPVHKKIPVLLHNGRPIPESMVILEFVEEVWPQPPLFPTDPYDRATARFWGDYIYQISVTSGRKLFFAHSKQEREEAKQEFLERFTVLNNAFLETSRGRPFFMGHSFGYVDLMFAALVYLIPSIERVGEFKFPNQDERPRFHEWIQALQEHPCVKPLRPDEDRLVDFFNNLHLLVAKKNSTQKHVQDREQ